MVDSNALQALFERQMQHHIEIGKHSASQRLQRLDALEKALKGKYRAKFRESLQADFKKPPVETDLTEIFPLLSAIKHTRANLRSWMQPKRVPTPLTLLGSSSYYYYEPRGVCLILSPWNFPVNLTLSPLISAIAAGNTAILKPSEMTPHTSSVLQELVDEVFQPEEVSLVQGDAETAKALLELPFHHIFFTGSTAVGKKIMAAAAKHLSSVTLELGGKSPTLVDRSANLAQAAERIAWGKFTNAGQICVAPDYLLVDRSVREEFISHLTSQIAARYGDGKDPEVFARIVNENHYQRLERGLENAVDKGARVIYGGDRYQEGRFLAPTLVEQVAPGSTLLQEEIFGPLLPILEYDDIEEAVNHIRDGGRPLALYVFATDKKRIRQVLKATRAGSTAINATVLQYGNDHLPFGGVNQSGIGKSHGIFGFREFSNTRSVLRQSRFGVTRFLYPPYPAWKKKLVDWTLRLLG